MLSDNVTVAPRMRLRLAFSHMLRSHKQKMFLNGSKTKVTRLTLAPPVVVMLPHLLNHCMPDTLSLPTAVRFYERRLISSAILSGAAATLDDAVTEAVVARVESIADVRALLRQLQRESLAKKPAAIVRGPFLAEMLLDAAMLQVRRCIVS